MFADSSATLTSRMRLSEAERFSLVVLTFLIVWSRRFWYAPRLERSEETVLIAESTPVSRFCEAVTCAELVPEETADEKAVSRASRFSELAEVSTLAKA